MDPVELARTRERARNGEARAIRERAHVSRAELAAGLGVHPTTVQKWEAGHRVPRGAVAEQYGRLLNELAQVAS